MKVLLYTYLQTILVFYIHTFKTNVQHTLRKSMR